MRERHKEGGFGRGTEGGGASARPRLCSLTLEGIVIGLDALTDGLLQVPLLYTLDPQVLEAESPPRNETHWLCPACPSLLHPFSRSPLRFTPSNGFLLCCEETHSLPWLTSTCALRPGPSYSPCWSPTLSRSGFFLFSKHTKLTLHFKACAFVHSAWTVFFHASPLFLTTQALNERHFLTCRLPGLPSTSWLFL